MFQPLINDRENKNVVAIMNRSVFVSVGCHGSVYTFMSGRSLIHMVLLRFLLVPKSAPFLKAIPVSSTTSVRMSS